NPDAVRAKPVWDACTALAGALDTEADTAKLVRNGLNSCFNSSRSISFAAEPPPSAEPKPPRETSIGGNRVRIYEQEENCPVYWRRRPFDSRYAPTRDYQVAVTSTDCDNSANLAYSSMAVLKEAPPTDVAPQRPLLYRPDEPDSPYPGACAYVDDTDP